MRTSRALFAGVTGAMAMSAVMAAFRLAGIHTDLEAILGSLFVQSPGAARWLTGFLIHLGMGSVIACFYAACFEFAVQRAGIIVGGGIGLSHGLLAGLCMSGIAEMNPLSGTMHSSSGAFFQNISASVMVGPLLFMLLHVLFGAVVGMIYGDPVQETHFTVDAGSPPVEMTGFPNPSPLIRAGSSFASDTGTSPSPALRAHSDPT